jgi:hypothetical protein
MRKLIMVLTLAILTLAPIPVMAQNQVNLSLVNVDIWPEYDQPSVLIIYRITLASGTILPANLALRIPSDGQINAVAVVDSANGLINSPYNSTTQGKWTIVNITANTLQVQIEYYVPLSKTGAARHIVYEWPGDYAVDRLDVNFLRPFGADNVSLSLEPVSTSTGQDGLTNYLIQTTKLELNQQFSLTIDYTRQTDDLIISSQPVQAASTPGEDTPGRISMTGIIPWALAGIGVLLIAVGVIWFVSWQRKGHDSSKGKKQVTQRGQTGGEAIYCPQCGKRAQPEDIFCRTCGTRLKR